LNRLDLIKALAPGFLPLIVFIAADSLWGTTIGLVVAILSGLVELGVTWWKDRRIDSFILLDTALIVWLGGMSLGFHNDIFFRLKPALIELVMCFLLAVSVFTPHNLLLGLMKRYLRRVTFTDAQLRQLKRSLRTMLAILAGHTLLVIYAAFFMSRQAWGVVSGGMFYLVFIFFLAAEWLRKRRERNAWAETYRDDEWFDLVDAMGKPRGRAPRTICHSGRGWLHAVVHLHVLNGDDQLLLQRRSLTKLVQPGKWDTAVGGHVQSGETVSDALRREAMEELGLEGFRAVPVARYLWESEIESELVFMYITRTNRPFCINREEISEARFWKVKKIRENLGKGILTPNFECEFPLLMKQLFGQEVLPAASVAPAGKGE
jgi:isopentenyldiphosphate isomerase/intracellular septation protein A